MGLPATKWMSEGGAWSSFRASGVVARGNAWKVNMDLARPGCTFEDYPGPQDPLQDATKEGDVRVIALPKANVGPEDLATRAVPK